MDRRTAREIALAVSFSVVAGEDFADDALDAFFDREHYATLGTENPIFAEYPNKKQMDYIRRLVTLVYDHRVELNAYIEKYARGWKTERISRSAAAIMRAALCEVLYMDDIPDSAAINEAVELAKRYEARETVSFINGILGGFMRGERGCEPEPETAEEPAFETADENAK